jgi:hypothetical protein
MRGCARETSFQKYPPQRAFAFESGAFFLTALCDDPGSRIHLLGIATWILVGLVFFHARVWTNGQKFGH